MSFISFSEIQNEYPKIEEMTNDLHFMNIEAKKHADFFNIDIDKWNNWYQSNTNKSCLISIKGNYNI